MRNLLKNKVENCRVNEQLSAAATLEKLSSIEDRGQTDRVTALQRPHWPLTLIFTYDLDFQSQASYGHYPHRHKKLVFKGQSVQKIEWKRTDGQMLLIALPSRLTRSVINLCRQMLQSCCLSIPAFYCTIASWKLISAASNPYPVFNRVFN